MLGGSVHRVLRPGVAGGDARDVDDVAPLALHHPIRLAAAQGHADDVGLQRLPPLLHAALQHVVEGVDAGVVHHDVETAELLHRAVHQVSHLLLVPHVHQAHGGAAGVSRYLFGRLFHRRLRAAGEDNGGFLAAQRLGDGQPYARTGTGNYGDFVLKLGQRVSSSWSPVRRRRL